MTRPAGLLRRSALRPGVGLTLVSATACSGTTHAARSVPDATLRGQLPICHGPGRDDNLRPVSVVDVVQQGVVRRRASFPTDDDRHAYVLAVRPGRYTLRVEQVPGSVSVTVTGGQVLDVDLPSQACL